MLKFRPSFPNTELKLCYEINTQNYKHMLNSNNLFKLKRAFTNIIVRRGSHLHGLSLQSVGDEH